MKGKKLLAGALSAAMVLSTMSFNVFAADNVAKIGDVEYASFAEALTAANSMTGDVTIDLTADASLKSDIKVTNKTTVNLGGNKLTLDATSNASNPGIGVAGNIEFIGDADKTSSIDIVSNDACGGDALICLGWAGMPRADVKMTDLTFNAPLSYDNGCGLFGVYSTSAIQFNNVTINANSNICTDENRCKTVFYGEGLNANTDIKINNTQVFATKNECVFYGFENADIDGLNYEGQIEEYVFSVVKGTVKNSTFTYKNTQQTKSIMRDAGYETTLTFEETVFNDVPNCTGGVFKLSNSNSVISADENTAVNSTVNQNAFAAKIGDTSYASLDSAFAAAQANDTIVLYADAEPTLRYDTNHYYLTNAHTIDLNGHKLTLKKNADIWITPSTRDTTPMTIKSSASEKGVLDVSNHTLSGTSVFYMHDNQSLVLDNVKVNADGLKGYALFASGSHNYHNTIKLNNSEISANSSPKGVTQMFDQCDMEIIDTNINASYVGKIAAHGEITISGASTITGNNIKVGFYMTQGTSSLDVKDTANVSLTNVLGDDDWNPTGAGIYLGEQTPYTKADTATVNANVYKTVTVNNTADKVEVKFVPTAEANVYDIVVVPTDNTKVINRLSAAEFDFELRTDDAMSFVVAGAENVNVTRDNNDHILFNFDGVSEADASGVEVKLGTVTINGYGTFAFGIKADGNNKVQTAELADNIVYTAEAAKLTVTNTITAELTVPTKELTINIDFPNAVTDNAKEYQDMKVTVVGGTENRTFNLGTGTDGVAMVDGKYVITTNLPENTPYTVEVSGAGYRTARYTVTMNADKTLNFWNNVKDNATVVETGNEAIKKNVTFLAGELVNDGKINIYDLSAVVSYFGATNLVDEHPEYAKYDLNRDGKIDSKDIAYVLVSWGK